MARETQKEKIERLEKSLNNANNIIQQLNNEISSMIDKADNSFENSSTYKQMSKQIETLELKIKAITDTAEHNRKLYENEVKTNEVLNEEIQKLKNEKTKKSNKKLIKEIEELKKEIDLKENTIKMFCDEKFEAEEKCRRLERNHNKVIEAYMKDLERVKEEYKNKLGSHKKHNERGAGRKSRFTQSEIETIKMYRLQGKTIKEIAKMFNCSVGLIHKLICEK